MARTSRIFLPFDNWPAEAGRFVKVMPRDFKRVLEESKRAAAQSNGKAPRPEQPEKVAARG